MVERAEAPLYRLSIGVDEAQAGLGFHATDARDRRPRRGEREFVVVAAGKHSFEYFFIIAISVRALSC